MYLYLKYVSLEIDVSLDRVFLDISFSFFFFVVVVVVKAGVGMLYLVSCFFSSCLSLSLFYAYVLALFRRVYLQYTLHYKAKVFSDLGIRILKQKEK